MELKFDFENPKYLYIDTVEKANESFDVLFSQKVLGVDVETTGFDPYTETLLLVQVSTPEVCYIFDARKIKPQDIPQIKTLLEDKSKIKITHNGKFDYKMIKQIWKIDMENLYDTMLAENVLTAGLTAGYFKLKDLVKKYTQLDLKKEVRDSFTKMTQSSKYTKEQLSYAALDGLVLFPVFDAQLVALQKENLVNIAKLEFATTRVVGTMELTGVYINEQRWRQIIGELSSKRDVLAFQFQDAIKPYYSVNKTDLFGNQSDMININSQPQLMDLFNNRLGLNLPSTGDAVLANYDHPIVKTLRDYRNYEKLVSAFGESLLSKINKVTGRIHPDFNQVGAATGRFSCNNPNFQQIPKETQEVPLRSCFNPKPGYKLVVSDYSSMEMRILADLSGDPKMIEAVSGSDVHSFTAALMFNKEFTKDFKKLYPELRQAAKAINFGLMYGMGSNSLARQIGVTPEVGQEYMNKYFQAFPNVRKFLDGMAQMAIKRGWSMTPAGRKRWYKIPDTSDPECKKKIAQIGREAKNHPIQGSNADAVKYALVFLQDRIKKEGIDGGLILTVHDEIVSEIREDQAEDWAKVQSAEMVRAAKLFLKKIDIIAEPFVGDVWEH